MVEFRAERSDEFPGRELVAGLDALFNAQYPGRAATPGSVTTSDEMAPPSGAFLVGYEEGRAVAIGGLRALRDGVWEIKRMYVVPDARSRGIGRKLLAALEDAGRRLGFRTVPQALWCPHGRPGACAGSVLPARAPRCRYGRTALIGS